MAGPGVKLWTAPPIWRGEKCFVIAGGPSLRGFDFERLRGRKVIAINSSVFSAPFAQYCFFGDDRWGQENRPRLQDYKGTVVTTSNGNLIPWACRMLNCARGAQNAPPLATDRSSLFMDRTSLHAAINLAVHFGVKRIVLLGADMRKGAGGVTHHHSPHPWPSIAGCWDLQMKQLALLAPPLKTRGIEVVNTSMESRIGWWPKHPIEELLT